MTEFQYKTYRCEWIAEVFPVDQYDRRTKEPSFYEMAFPTFEEAREHFDEITETRAGSSPLRRFWKGKAPHPYYSVTVRYRETPVE